MSHGAFASGHRDFPLGARFGVPALILEDSATHTFSVLHHVLLSVGGIFCVPGGANGLVGPRVLEFRASIVAFAS